MSTALTVPVPEQWPYSDIRAEASHFVEALKASYEHEHAVLCPPVVVRLTGRRATGRMGCYSPKKRGIVVNDADMSDYAVRATLVHELAHHFQCTCSLQEGNTRLTKPGPSHGIAFQVHHMRLRVIAVREGFLPPLEKVDQTLCQVASRIQGLRRTSGEAVLEIGRELSRARERCRQIGESFEVFLQDQVTFDRTTAYDYIRAHEMGMPPDLNYTTMRFLMRIRDEEARQDAVADAIRGVSLVILRLRYGAVNKRRGDGEDEKARLLKEKTRLQRRLGQIEDQLAALVQTRTKAVPGVAANET